MASEYGHFVNEQWWDYTAYYISSAGGETGTTAYLSDIAAFAKDFADYTVLDGVSAYIAIAAGGFTHGINLVLPVSSGTGVRCDLDYGTTAAGVKGFQKAYHPLNIPFLLNGQGSIQASFTAMAAADVCYLSAWGHFPERKTVTPEKVIPVTVEGVKFFRRG